MPFEIQIGEDTVEVNFDQITKVEDGYVLKTQKDLDDIIGKAKGSQETRLKKEHQAALDSLKEELSEDDDFFATIASNRGIELDKNNKVVKEVSPEKIQELRHSWQSQYLDPVKEENTKLSAQVDKTRKSLLMRDIQAAAASAGLRKELLHNPLNPDTPGHFIFDLASQAKWNDEDGTYSFVDKDGDYIQNNDGVRASAKDVVARIKLKDKDHMLFEDPRPKKTDQQGKTTSDRTRTNGKATMSMAEFKKLTPRERQKLSIDKIAKGELKIVED